SPKWKSTVRSARTHAPALRACVQIAPDRPSVAGTPADKRFGNGASDTSKINFKGVHQTGSTPQRPRMAVPDERSTIAVAGVDVLSDRVLQIVDGMEGSASDLAACDLDLAFLVNRNDHRVLGRVHVEADDVLNLLGELRVVGALEGANTVRLQPIRLPQA